MTDIRAKSSLRGGPYTATATFLSYQNEPKISQFS